MTGVRRPRLQVSGALAIKGFSPPEASMATAASFEIEYLQYLGPDGKLVRKDLPAFAKDLELLRELFRTMLFTRVFDTKAVNLQRTGKLGTYASCLGH